MVEHLPRKDETTVRNRSTALCRLRGAIGLQARRLMVRMYPEPLSAALVYWQHTSLSQTGRFDSCGGLISFYGLQRRGGGGSRFRPVMKLLRDALQIAMLQ